MLFTELQCFSDLFCVGFFLSSHNLSSICYSITRQSDVGNPFYFCEFSSTVFFQYAPKWVQCGTKGSFFVQNIYYGCSLDASTYDRFLIRCDVDVVILGDFSCDYLPPKRVKQNSTLHGNCMTNK